ncbi:MAG: aminotransferase class III-fold pyridoxal phosphate-dependent enzyme, partial [Candidatus Heimdallarchaeota archaeon]|nr:aminotransferase class III-fold pyridoxal phosphate-dependent enzyme [Candidatus Heimdallarchaeota archaeon]
HNHPYVVENVTKQSILLNTNTRYLHPALIEYAEKLTSLLPESLEVCYFVNSGSEANELALRLAKSFSEKSGILVIDHAYHGNTNLLIEISPYKFNGQGGQGKSKNVELLALPDPFRLSEDEIMSIVNSVEDKIKSLETYSGGLAAFIHESLPGVGGHIIYPDGFLSSVYSKIRKRGGVCIADEVQVGFGRVGSKFWGFELQKVVPDIVTLGKPIGNGFPIGAVITSKKIAEKFDNGMEFFSTTGGNPVAAAAGLSVLQVIEQERLQYRANELGKYFLSKLQLLKDKYPLIGDVRGVGLFLGVELIKDENLTPASDEANYIIEELKKIKIILSIDGPLRNVLKFKPPLQITRENIDDVVTALDEIMAHNVLNLRNKNSANT